MLIILFGDYITGFIILKGNKVQEEFFSSDIQDLFKQIHAYRGLPIRLILLNKNTQFFYKRIPRFSRDVAIDVEMDKCSSSDLSHNFASDIIKNVYLFFGISFNESQRSIMEFISRDLNYLFVAHVELYQLMREISMGAAKRHGIKEVLIIDTKVSGFLVALWQDGMLLKFEEIDVMNEIDHNIIAGFIMHYLVELESDFSRIDVYLIARASVSEAVLCNNFGDNVINIIALNSLEAGILLGLEADGLQEYDHADLTLSFLFSPKVGVRAHKIPLGNAISYRSLFFRFVCKFCSIVTVLVLGYFGIDLYLQHSDYQVLSRKNNDLVAKYYALMSSISFDRDEDLMWIYQMIAAVAENPANSISRLRLVEQKVKSLDWNLLYAPEQLMHGKVDPKVKINIKFFKSNGNNHLEIVE